MTAHHIMLQLGNASFASQGARERVAYLVPLQHVAVVAEHPSHRLATLWTARQADLSASRLLTRPFTLPRGRIIAAGAGTPNCGEPPHLLIHVCIQGRDGKDVATQQPQQARVCVCL